VSIKNKLVTAVTTAGLLAGLFGSAFVPTAHAAGREGAADPAPKASLTTVTEDDSGLIMEGATNKFGFLSSDSDVVTADDDVAITFVIKSAGGVNVENADLKAVSSNSAVKVAWAYATALDGDGNVVADACEDIDGDAGGNDGVDDGAGAFSTSDIVAEAPDGAAASYILCFAAATSTSAGTSTVTISAAAAGTGEYVVLKTITVTAIGPIASLELSITDGYKYVAEGNDELGEWLTVVGKDSNGTIINGDTGTISAGFDLVNTVTEWEDNPLHNDDDTAINFFTGDSGVNNADGGSTLYDLEANTCLDDADDDYDDAGSSFSLKIANAAQTVVSNAITITCTTDSASVARVTRIYAEATTGASIYNETATGSDDFLSLFAVIVDANGMPLGDGAATQDFVWSIDGDTAITSEFTDNGTEVAVGGEIELGTLCETIAGGECTAGIDFGRNGRFTYTVTAADSDLSTATNVAFEAELTYLAVGEDDVAISRTRNAAKTRATITADMGESNAFERIEFYVELSNGNVKTYTRRANASGVATLVQARRRTTVYVYADVEAGGSPTDVLKVVFK